MLILFNTPTPVFHFLNISIASVYSLKNSISLRDEPRWAFSARSNRNWIFGLSGGRACRGQIKNPKQKRVITILEFCINRILPVFSYFLYRKTRETEKINFTSLSKAFTIREIARTQSRVQNKPVGSREVACWRGGRGWYSMKKPTLYECAVCKIMLSSFTCASLYLSLNFTCASLYLYLNFTCASLYLYLNFTCASLYLLLITPSSDQFRD